MLVRGRRLCVTLAFCLIPVLFFVSFRSWDENIYNQIPKQAGQWADNAGQWAGHAAGNAGEWAGNIFPHHQTTNLPPTSNDPSAPAVGQALTSAEGLSQNANYRKFGRPDGSPEIPPHRELFSLTTPTKKYFRIVFGNEGSLNPNIIPHPSLENTWIMVAQQQRSNIDNSIWFAELVCNANFSPDGNVLACTSPPTILPIGPTFGDKCEGEIYHFNFNVGPHDGRVFYGPKHPYAIYGSNSRFTCFGMFMQDLRMLTDWGLDSFALDEPFRMQTELQRPPPYSRIEKNWFIFWDQEENVYAHYDIYPKRAFSKLALDGSVVGNRDLAEASTPLEKKCLEKLMPFVVEESRDKWESVHQASNSLAITLCKRGECTPDATNTFVITIFQFKSFYAFHGVYEPFVMLFQQVKPFAVHAIGKNPLWINGRGAPGAPSDDPLKRDDQTEMIYVTSISWKSKENKYQGFLDDVMFIGFGIEDSRPGAIDVIAGDLVKDLGFCKDVS